MNDHMVLVSGESMCTTKNKSTLVSSISFNFLYSLTVKIIGYEWRSWYISNIILIKLVMLSYNF